jgi:hypothetical protein
MPGDVQGPAAAGWQEGTPDSSTDRNVDAGTLGSWMKSLGVSKEDCPLQESRLRWEWTEGWHSGSVVEFDEMKRGCQGQDRLFRELLRDVPEFTEVLREHVGWYDEILGCVLINDFLRFLQRHHEEESAGESLGDAGVLARGVAFVNRNLGREEYVDGVIHEFVEGPWAWGEPEFRARFSPEIQALVRLWEGPRE